MVGTLPYLRSPALSLQLIGSPDAGKGTNKHSGGRQARALDKEGLLSRFMCQSPTPELLVTLQNQGRSPSAENLL